MAMAFPPHYMPSLDPTLYHDEQQSNYYDPSAFYPQQYQQQQQQPQLQSHQQAFITPTPPTDQTPEAADPILALNLRVLRRHLPSTLRILYQAQYAVIYTFSPQSTGWEKSGKEGTLFIVQETPRRPGAQNENSAALVVLNRRGMDNFVMRDWDPQVQSEGGHIILRGRVEGEAVNGSAGVGAGAGVGEGEDLTVWGVWIWEEEDLGSTKGKREGVEKCLVACASGDVAAEKEEEEDEEEDGRPLPESEVALHLDGDDSAVFDQHEQPFGRWSVGESQQQQQQWNYEHPEHISQHYQPQQQQPQQQHQHHHQQYSNDYQNQQQHQQIRYHPSYQPTPSNPPEQQPTSPNLMALLNGSSSGRISEAATPYQQQPAFPPPPTTNMQQQQQQMGNIFANANTNTDPDILGQLFRNAGR